MYGENLKLLTNSEIMNVNPADGKKLLWVAVQGNQQHSPSIHELHLHNC